MALFECAENPKKPSSVLGVNNVATVTSAAAPLSTPLLLVALGVADLSLEVAVVSVNTENSLRSIFASFD